MNRPKRVHRHSFIGQEGVNLIATNVAEMGFLWTPTTGHSDAGIDGFIEILKPDTGEVTNLILQVQSKATAQQWENETPENFEFRCSDRDLDYWMQGNAPVLLVVSRPKTDEAYFVSVKDYFRDPERRKSKKVRFDKQKNLFSECSAGDLISLAAPSESGIYLAPPPIEEILSCNLLPVARHPQKIYVASTDFPGKEDIWKVFNEQSVQDPKAWLLREKKIYSFCDLRLAPWTQICDVKTVEQFDSELWSLSQNPILKGDFVQLLNLSLRDILGARNVRFLQPKNGRAIFYFSSTKDLTPRIIEWKRLKVSQRTVFSAHYGKVDKEKIVYFRHFAFIPRFTRLGGQWYLEITPTYHFTSDGKQPSRYRESYLSGIKRLEKHAAVHGNLEFWGAFLTKEDFFLKPGFLTFHELLRFESDFGIPEADWLSRADEEEKERLSDTPENQIFVLI